MYGLINLYSRNMFSNAIYLYPYGSFKMKSSVELPHQVLKATIAILKAVPKDQGADDIGDSIVEGQVWFKGFA